MKTILIIISIIFTIFSCANPRYLTVMQEESVGQIPCNAEHIEIIEHKINREEGSATWTALCNGRSYFCKRPGTNNTDSENLNVTCEESIAQMPE